MTPEEAADEITATLRLSDAGRKYVLSLARETVATEREECAKVCESVFGGKSHKVSENSDRYRVQDETVDICAKAIRTRK